MQNMLLSRILSKNLTTKVQELLLLRTCSIEFLGSCMNTVLNKKRERETGRTPKRWKDQFFIPWSEQFKRPTHCSRWSRWWITSPVILSECKTWSLLLREGYISRTFENRMLRRIDIWTQKRGSNKMTGHVMVYANSWMPLNADARDRARVSPCEDC